MSAATKIRFGGSWQTIIGCRVYAVGAWRKIVSIKVYQGGQWRLVGNFTTSAPPPSSPPPTNVGTLTLTASPTSFLSSFRDTFDQAVNITATPSGGLAPYSYTWTLTSSSGGVATISLLNTTLATVNVRASFSDYGPETATVHCVCTDHLGTTASVSVSGTFRNTAPIVIGGGGPIP